MTAKDKAQSLFNTYYTIFMEHGGECSEEILVSVLSIQCGIVACETIIKEYKEMYIDNKFWKAVITELKAM